MVIFFLFLLKTLIVGTCLLLELPNSGDLLSLGQSGQGLHCSLFTLNGLNALPCTDPEHFSNRVQLQTREGILLNPYRAK